MGWFGEAQAADVVGFRTVATIAHDQCAAITAAVTLILVLFHFLFGPSLLLFLLFGLSFGCGFKLNLILEIFY